MLSAGEGGRWNPGSLYTGSSLHTLQSGQERQSNSPAGVVAVTDHSGCPVTAGHLQKAPRPALKGIHRFTDRAAEPDCSTSLPSFSVAKGQAQF